jgi:putative oxidoreductase
MRKKIFIDLEGNIIIRLMVGMVFLSEGIQKLIMPALNGTGRFIKIGIPHAAFFGPFVGITEIICSTLLIAGFFTRLVCIPLLIVILMAIYYTKLPIFEEKGFWSAAHEGRADFCMLMGLIFLLKYGAGKYSLDGTLTRNGRK